MSNNIAFSETSDDIVCEAIGCYSTATNKIVVKVGAKETITIFVCNDCKPRFVYYHTAIEIIGAFRANLNNHGDQILEALQKDGIIRIK